MIGIRVRCPGRVRYEECYLAQRRYTDERSEDSVDEFWCVEHDPVYTLGLSGRTEHLLNTGSIAVVHTDRGGQVTYHGPGQLVVYPLLDLRRRGISVRDYVSRLEQAVIDMLADCGVVAERRAGAPGVYVDKRKIAALGIRIRRGYCYHGLALNVDMDLTPFQGINPCGYHDLEVTSLAQLGIPMTMHSAMERLVPALAMALGGSASDLNWSGEEWKTEPAIRGQTAL